MKYGFINHLLLKGFMFTNGNI